MGLIEESRRLAPELAANAAEEDGLRRLSDRTWKSLLEGGFLRAMQPARFGGGRSRCSSSSTPFELALSPSAGWVAA
jgi:3-hydroxy-9,10-secoandrosta-1,3,5(10)-triene-9,17-dione monooxygenase